MESGIPAVAHKIEIISGLRHQNQQEMFWKKKRKSLFLQAVN